MSLYARAPMCVCVCMCKIESVSDALCWCNFRGCFSFGGIEGESAQLRHQRHSSERRSAPSTREIFRLGCDFRCMCARACFCCVLR